MALETPSRSQRRSASVFAAGTKMISLLKKSRALTGLKADFRSVRNAFFRSQAVKVSRYLADAGSPSLHLGASNNRLSGWLDTDLFPLNPDTMFLDATKPFPISSASFEYIYSEHMIEHIPFDAGIHMLRECRRVLKRGGVLRIATPDMAFVLSLFSTPCEDGQRYLQWISDSYLDQGSFIESSAARVINQIFRGWGHQFIYDAGTLEASLLEAGFTQIVRAQYGESTYDQLRGIESHGKSVGNIEMAKLETMIFEAS